MSSSLIRKTFAKQLRSYRKYLALSQEVVAQRLGIAKTTIIEWEKFDGRWQPSWEKLEEMCSWTGIKPIYFFVDDGFGSDHLELSERIRALGPEFTSVIEQMLAYAEGERRSRQNVSPRG